jgi:hypothetical protein
MTCGSGLAGRVPISSAPRSPNNGECPVEHRSLGLLEGYALLSEVAADLGVCIRTLRRKINQPNGWPCVTVGGKLRLHVPTIRKIIEAETKSRNPRRSTR